jgi:ferric-dicitrate binding protein FerR (iron transport regulator)
MSSMTDEERAAFSKWRTEMLAERAALIRANDTPAITAAREELALRAEALRAAKRSHAEGEAALEALLIDAYPFKVGEAVVVSHGRRYTETGRIKDISLRRETGDLIVTDAPKTKNGFHATREQTYFVSLTPGVTRYEEDPE